MDGPTAPAPAGHGSTPPGAAAARDPHDAGSPAPGPPDLRPLGLVTGDRVRWRDRSSSRWREGRVVGRERDGSVGIRDGRGASRALRPERLEVHGRGPRGGTVWEPVPERAARTEQLGLWEREASAPEARPH